MSEKLAIALAGDHCTVLAVSNSLEIFMFDSAGKGILGFLCSLLLHYTTIA